MKKICTITILAVVTFTFASVPSLPANSYFMPVCTGSSSLDISRVVEDDGWILIGEVTLSNYYLGNEPIVAKLYVREIAKKLIYRVEYQGVFYATRWHEKSNTYHVTINGETYIYDDPANYTNKETDSGNSAKFVGKWKLRDFPGWYVDISFSNGRYSFNLNPDKITEIVEFQETSNGVVFTYVEKFDKRPELNRKGWRYYYNERDNNADPGYPTSGRYEYDREVVYYTASITLSDMAPVRKMIKMHTYYYLGTALTYADTDTDFSMPGFTAELTKY